MKRVLVDAAAAGCDGDDAEDANDHKQSAQGSTRASSDVKSGVETGATGSASAIKGVISM
jgi:hypothetical protein